MNSGDIITYHGQQHVVACVHEPWLHTCGHPEYRLRTELCTLVTEATAEQRQRVLEALASSSSTNHRPVCARATLAQQQACVGDADG